MFRREVGLMELKVMAEADEDPQEFLNQLFAGRPAHPYLHQCPRHEATLPTQAAITHHSTAREAPQARS
jgi:hypothetical protein